MSTETTQPYTYNRIVIIGNGYDLALGMRTSYSDFLIAYLKSCLAVASRENYEDDLLFIGRSKIIEGYITSLNNETEFKSLVSMIKDLKIEIIFKSLILEKILSNFQLENWVDIESLYFELLVSYIDHLNQSESNKQRKNDSIRKLNEEFKIIASNLEKYIFEVDNKFFINNYSSKFRYLIEYFTNKQTPKKTGVSYQKEKSEINDPERVLFLNFNYTKSFLKTFNSSINPVKHSFIDIHGNALSQSNPIIFGYGDDSHHKYKAIELEDSLEPLVHIKSFHYPKTANYLNLLDFMSLDKYEVFILGHSCGLSDRILLKTIFEDKNCLSIKIFHRGKEDHFRKTIAISKHFENKANLRSKIIPFDTDFEIPQEKKH